MDKQRIQYLHDQHLQDTLSKEEQLEWESILNDPANEQVLQELVYRSWDNMSADDKIRLRGNRSEEIFAEISGMAQPVVRRITLWPRIAAAAAIILISGAGLFYYHQKNKTDQTNQVAKNDIAPGGNKAFLTLANGKRISLTDAANGTIAKQAGVFITKTANGQLTYSISNSNHNTPEELQYNTVETPKGGQYQVQLPDGTVVWLNAASSLKYPASFVSLKDRKVELIGEAYFEVAKDKAHPFIVKSNNQDVEVLGTHFNINSYADEPSTKTTLLEGSVEVSTTNNKVKIKPGEQAAMSPAGKITVAQTDVDDAVAWKNGKFVFDNENLESIMRKLARWYNVEVVYKDNVSDRAFAGSISRYDNISKILDKITFTQAVHFKIEGRRVTVMR